MIYVAGTAYTVKYVKMHSYNFLIFKEMALQYIYVYNVLYYSHLCTGGINFKIITINIFNL